jgi:hypothetical protein
MNSICIKNLPGWLLFYFFPEKHGTADDGYPWSASRRLEGGPTAMGHGVAASTCCCAAVDPHRFGTSLMNRGGRDEPTAPARRRRLGEVHGTRTGVARLENPMPGPSSILRTMIMAMFAAARLQLGTTLMSRRWRTELGKKHQITSKRSDVDLI